MLGDDSAFTELANSIRNGTRPVAVVDGRSPAVSMSRTGSVVAETIHRIDPFVFEPHVIVVVDDTVAWLLPPDVILSRQLSRTGIAGAITSAVTVAGAPIREIAIDSSAVRLWLRLGAAAVAAGIAAAASSAAVTYAAGRVQFGGPLTDLPTVREALFESSGSAAIALRAALSPSDITPWQAATILDAACAAAIDAATIAVQTHGGDGYLTEYRAERLLRDSISMRAACDCTTTRHLGAAELVASATHR
jgi:hypothetical protein